MQVTIEKLIFGGAGLARTDQGVIFVPKSVPGDVVEIDVTEQKKGFALATIRQIVTPSNFRRIPACPNFESVGCCHWDHVEYPQQIQSKKDIIRESLSRLAKIPYEDDIAAISGPEHGYRMRASFHVWQRELCFVRENTHVPIPIAECAALAPELNQFIPAFNALQIPASQVDVVSNESQIAVTVRFPDDDPQQTWDRWRDALFGIAGVVNLTFVAGTRRLRYGKHNPSIDVAGSRYELSSDAFFQTNRFLLSDFTAAVMKEVGTEPKNVLELFSGSGFFSIPIARVCRQLIGIESNPVAVRHARESAKSNKLANADFALGTVGTILAGSHIKPDAVVLNPPRTGAGAKVIAMVAALKAPRIVYISCNPTTLAPEMKILNEKGYRLKRLTMIDQFPNTYHIELVARFELE